MNEILEREQHSQNASYSNGKADLCGDLLEQLPQLPDEVRNMLYDIQHTERSQAITELKKCIKLFNKKSKE